MYYSWEAVVFIHRLWNNVYNRWITNNLPSKWHITTSTASGWKSSPRKIFHWNSSGERRLKFIGERIEGDNHEAENIAQHSEGNVVNTATTNVYRGSSKIVQLHCKRSDEEREHRLPTLPKATRLDQATRKVYSQNYLLRCSNRQQEYHVKNIFPTDSEQPISLYTMSNNGSYSKLYFTMNSLEHR